MTAAIRAAALALTLAITQTGPGIAAQTAPASADTTRPRADSARAAVIRTEDIPSQADRTAARLQDLEALLAPDPAVLRIVTESEGLAGRLDTIIQMQQRLTRRLVTRRALAEYSLEWDRTSAEIRAQRNTLQNRIGTLQKSRDEVTALAGQWTAAIGLARSDSATATVLNLAEETLGAARDLEQRIRARTDELLAAEVHLSEAQLVVQRQVEALRQQIAEQRKDLLRIDSQPLWRIGRDQLPSQMGAEIRLLLAEDLLALVEFVRIYGTRLLFHLTLTLLLIGFFRRGQARLAANPDDPLHAEPASVILQRPVA
ncbi:MAG TPA: hypothetical protein VLL51_10000, partial [Gemmatimonadales bacterium]|nr:hypothetical protein [Gemmatimonadales bacterium]